MEVEKALASGSASASVPAPVPAPTTSTSSSSSTTPALPVPFTSKQLAAAAQQQQQQPPQLPSLAQPQPRQAAAAPQLPEPSITPPQPRQPPAQRGSVTSLLPATSPSISPSTVVPSSQPLLAPELERHAGQTRFANSKTVIPAVQASWDAIAPVVPEGKHIMADTGIDLSDLPTQFLEAYPYPAFVLISPIPLPADEDADAPPAPLTQPPAFTRSTHYTIQPFEPVWTNSKWQNLTQGRKLLECMTTDGARLLGDWVSGAVQARVKERRISAARVAGLKLGYPPPSSSLGSAGALPTPRSMPSTTPSQGTSTTAAGLHPAADIDVDMAGPSRIGSDGTEAPPGFWEAEVPYEDRSSASDPHSASEALGIDSIEGLPIPLTLKVDLVRPGRVTLEFCQTRMPVHQYRRTGRVQMSTHTFTIITTIPRSAFIPNDPIAEEPAVRGSRGSSGAGIEGMKLDDPQPILGEQLYANQPKLEPRKTVLSSGGVNSTRSGVFGSPVAALRTAMTSPDDVGTELTSLDPTPGRPIFYNRDGSISRRPPIKRETIDGKSLDVHDLLNTTNWSQTPLGPREQWPQSLRTIVSLVMLYPHQCCLWWGPELTLIYNGPYSDTIHKHPHIFGMSGPVAWAEIWNTLGPLSELVLGGTPVYKEDDFLLFKQLPHQGSGTFEHYHSWMWVPVVQEDGSFGGLWNATIDTTKKVLAERRLATVREMGERTSIARTMREFDRAVVEILASNAKDVPFALLYHVEPAQQRPDSRKASVSGTIALADNGSDRVNVVYSGGVGVPDNHISAPAVLNISLKAKVREGRPGPPVAFSHSLHSPAVSMSSSIGHAQIPRSMSPVTDDGSVAGGANTPHNPIKIDSWPIQEALTSRRLILIEDCLSMIRDYPIRIWDELPSSAVVVPIASDSDDGVPGAVLILGLSIRRPFDDDYESFIHVLKLQMASGLAAVRSYEAERMRIEDLAALDRAKSLLFSNVSHELRTPLTLVAGPIDDLLVETPDGPKKENLLMVRRNVRRLTRLVSTLMDVSRLEAGRLKGSFRIVTLGKMTRDLSALFRGAIERSKLKYIVECDLSAKDTYVDTEHWEKIIFNLIGNALKYTMYGSIKVSLSYTLTEAVFAVQDTGVGIPAKDLDLVGERFHRVQSVSRSHEGTGIGLALVKELIKLHGGTLEIESVTEPESLDGSHGSVFRVRLPLGRDHLPDEAIELIAGAEHEHPSQTTYGQGIVDEALQWNKDREGSSADDSSESGGSGGISGESSNQSSRGIDPGTLYFKKDDLILLVDDSSDTRRYMRSIFAPFCTVIEARDGVEAVDLVNKQPPDLIISDVMMPRLDGFGMLTVLKTGTRAQQMIPIIMLTARGGDEARVDGLLAGADDYLAKPFNARELIARAHMQVQLGRRRKALEDAFDERTTELRTLSEHSPVGIFRCDANGEVTYANQAWYEQSGFPQGSAVTNWGDYIKEEYRDAVRETWEQFFIDDAAERSAEWQWTNGRWVTTKVIRLDKVAPGLRGILGTVTDISERKLHEESQRQRVVEAEQRRAEAEEAKRQQELLIDITSHEIRNPISSLMQCSSLVKTNLTALLEQLQSSVQTNSAFVPTDQLVTTINEDLEALESIYQCGLTQERISNDVLSLGRIQLDMLQMFDVETDIHNEAQKVISIFQNEARMKRIALTLNIGESVERVGVNCIKTDPVRLGQVVTNLLSNGIRFTSNSSTRRIELRFDLSFDPPNPGSCLMPRPASRPEILKDDMPIYLYVAVTDTGPGLTPKDLEVLFQRFSQVSPKTHTVFGGSGLGLFVCRKITELMGGRIEVASEHGKGSTFRFFIQARTAQTQKRTYETSVSTSPELGKPLLKKRNTASSLRTADSPSHSSGRAAARPHLGPGPKPHVLVVEDNIINQTVLLRQLRHIGLTVEAADNGLEALEKIRRVSSTEAPNSGGQPFDCVLMDLEMPVMDGLTAVRHIREEEAAGKLSLNLVIALTGNARQGQIDEAKASGMDEVVIKPYRLDELLEKIEEMMKIRATKRSEASPAAAAGSGTADIEMA